MQHKVQLGIKYLQITISCFPETPLKLGHIKKKKNGFTPCKAGQPLQGMELQEKEAQEG